MQHIWISKYTIFTDISMYKLIKQIILILILIVMMAMITLCSSTSPLQWRRQAWTREAKPPKMSFSPHNVKHTGQEWGGELCKIFKFWSFLQSKSANNVCELLQLLWYDPIPLPGLRPYIPLGTRTPWAIASTNKTSWHRHLFFGDLDLEPHLWPFLSFVLNFCL